MQRGLASVAAHAARAARRVHNLATSPNATLRVSGAATKKLIVKTNMETYSAQLEAATADGTACSDDEVAAWATAHSNGDLDIRTQGYVTTISVPASFNVSVEMDGACDVAMEGWLEGTVDVIIGGMRH